MNLLRLLAAVVLCCAFGMDLQAQTASFTTSNNSGCAPLTVTFTNTSSGYSGGQTWYVNGQPISTTYDLTYTFTDPGYYDIYLEIDDGGNFYYSNYDWVSIGGLSDMIAVSDSGCIGDRMEFGLNFETGNGLGMDSIVFQFGDGTTQTVNWYQGHHYYTSNGDYQVMAIGYSPCGIDTMYTDVHIGSNVFPDQYNLDVYEDTVCPNDEFNVSTLAYYDVFTVAMGDGTIYNNEDYFEHSYQLPGVYTIVHTVQNGCGNTASTQEDIVVVSNYPIDPLMMGLWAQDTTCPNSVVDFGSSEGYPHYTWSFGDGDTAQSHSVEHSYSAPGQYIYSVNVTNGCGNSALLWDTIHVVANMPLPPITIISQISNDTICPEGVALHSIDYSFGNSSGSEITFNVYYSDGTAYYGVDEDVLYHSFADTGTFQIVAEGINGCGNTAYDTSYITVSALDSDITLPYQMVAIPSDPCPGDTVFIVAMPMDGSTLPYISMAFGDGDSTTNLTATVVENDGLTFNIIYAKHVYNSSGNYNITLYKEECGQLHTLQTQVNVGTQDQDEDLQLLWSDLAGYCAEDPITFYPIGMAEYQIDFGDQTGQVLVQGNFIPVQHSYANPGSYTIRVNGWNSCGAPVTEEYDIYVPDPAMSLTFNSVDATCGLDDGIAIVSVSGGDSPYTYLWDNGDTTLLADSLVAGIHVATITDSKGCTAFGVATVSDQEGPTIVVNGTVPVSCAGASDGAIDISVLGGNPPFTYLWTSGATTEDANGLAAGPHEVLVTDANGCVSALSIYLDGPDPISVAFHSNPSDCGLSNGSATAFANGNSGPYTYQWAHGTVGATTTGLAGGLYTCYVVDSYGCLSQSQVAINETNSPVIVTDSVQVNGCGSGGNAIYTTAVLGVPPYTYNWSNGGGTMDDLTGASPGTYTLTVTGADGCQSFEIFEIDFEPPVIQDLCMVTVDSALDVNRVVWEKNGSTQIQEFKVYRESSQAGLYYAIATVPYDSLSQYVDLTANPQTRSWRYRVSAVDSCGNESSLSSIHKTIHLVKGLGIGNDINLTWNAYQGITYNQYRILRYTDVDGMWTVLDSVSSFNHSYTDTAVPMTATVVDYMIEIDVPTCTADRADNYNSSRSNKTEPGAWGGGGPSAGIEEGSKLDLIVYPNPAQATVFVRMEGLERASEVRVLDMSGRMVRRIDQSDILGDVLRVESSGMSRGSYVVVVSHPAGIFRQVFQKQ